MGRGLPLLLCVACCACLLSFAVGLSFAPALLIPTGMMPQYPAYGDFNADSIIDFAVRTQGNQIQVFSGQGTGNFTLATTLSTGERPSMTRVADLNGDGRLDILVANAGENTVSWFRNTGTGGSIQFAPQEQIDMGTDQTYAVAACDLNGDSLLDLIAVGYQNDVFSVRLADAPGGHWSPTALSGSLQIPGPTWIECADVNSDSHLDLIASFWSFFSSVATGAVMYGRGDGTFDSRGALLNSTSIMNSGARQLVVADLNADSKLDVALAMSNERSVDLFAGNGNAPFNSGTASYKIPLTGTPVAIGSADFNHDGLPDLIVGYESSEGVQVCLNTNTAPGVFSFQSGADCLSLALGSAAYHYGVAGIDVNNDGWNDTLVVNAGDNQIAVFLQVGMPSSSSSSTAPYLSPSSSVVLQSSSTGSGSLSSTAAGSAGSESLSSAAASSSGSEFLSSAGAGSTGSELLSSTAAGSSGSEFLSSAGAGSSGSEPLSSAAAGSTGSESLSSTPAGSTGSELLSSSTASGSSMLSSTGSSSAAPSSYSSGDTGAAPVMISSTGRNGTIVPVDDSSPASEMSWWEILLLTLGCLLLVGGAAFFAVRYRFHIRKACSQLVQPLRRDENEKELKEGAKWKSEGDGLDAEAQRRPSY
jgi:hypothetical protein